MADSPYNKMWNSAYVKLCILELCLQLGMQTAQPVVSNAALAMGATVTVAGIMAGLSSAISLSLRIASGRFIARTPLKTVLVGSSAVLMVSSLIFALFSSLGTLVISRILYGASIVVKTVISVAVCVRIVPKSSIGQAVAWLGMGNVLAVAIGPNLTQFIGMNAGYDCSFFLSGALFTAGTILCATFPSLPLISADEDGKGDDSGDSGRAVVSDAGGQGATSEADNQVATSNVGGQGANDSQVPASHAGGQGANDCQVANNGTGNAHGNNHVRVRDGSVILPQTQTRGFLDRLGNYIYFDALPLAFLGVLEGTIFGIVNTLTLTVSQIRDMPEISLFFVVYVIVSFCMRPIVGKIYDRYGFARVCPTMCFIMTLAMLTFAFTDSLVMVVLDGVLFALGQGCLWPCLQAESVLDVPPAKSSLSTNTLLFGVDVGIMLGPMLGGAVLDVAGPMWMYLFATGVGICLTLWTIPYIRITRKRAARKDAEQGA